MPLKLRSDDREILAYYIELTADIDFFVIRIENNLRNRHATHLFGSDGFENLDYVLNKAAEISIRVFSFFSFFCGQCRFRTPRAVLFSLQIQVSPNSKQDGLQHSLALAV